MKDTALERFIKNGILVLEGALPRGKFLYFPLLFSALFWMVRRPREWKEKIFAWKIWADPGRISIKPDEFILFFFDYHKGLSRTYADEVKKRDIKSLRKAFVPLYPVVGLSDPFLCALFHRELAGKHYRRIVHDFAERTAEAARVLEPARTRSRIKAGLSGLFEELGSLAPALLGRAPSRRAFAAMIKKLMEKKDD